MTATATGPSSTSSEPNLKQVGGAGGAGSPPTNATPVQAAPQIQIGEFNLTPKGLEANFGPSVKIDTTTDSSGKTVVHLDFKGAALANDKGKVTGPRNTQHLAVMTGSATDPDAAKEVAARATEAIRQAAELLSQNEPSATTDARARKMILEALENLANTGALQIVSTGSVWAANADARLQELQKRIGANRPDIYVSYKPKLEDKLQATADMAVGVTRLSVKLNPGSTAAEGDVEELNIRAGRSGVQVEALGFRRESADPGAERSTQILAGGLENVLPYDPAAQASYQNQIDSVVPQLESMLPQIEPLSESFDLIGSTPGFNLVNLTGLTNMSNQTIKGYGHLHERLDPSGALLENVTVADGVFQIEGRLHRGSKIIVKEGATLMLDLEPGSEVELIIEKGAKIMSGPLGKGLSGCRVSGEIHGDASALDMRGVQWVSMTAKSFEGMIFDATRIDEQSRGLFWKESKAYDNLAQILKDDRANLTFDKLHHLVHEHAGTHTVMDKEGKPVGFAVQGADNRVIFVRQTSEGVMVGAGAPTQQLDLDETTDEELVTLVGDQMRTFQTEHQALVEILRLRGGGGFGVTVDAEEEQEQSNIRIVDSSDPTATP